jgi:hypothetical protein
LEAKASGRCSLAEALVAAGVDCLIASKESKSAVLKAASSLGWALRSAKVDGKRQGVLERFRVEVHPPSVSSPIPTGIAQVTRTAAEPKTATDKRRRDQVQQRLEQGANGTKKIMSGAKATAAISRWLLIEHLAEGCWSTAEPIAP